MTSSTTIANSSVFVTGTNRGLGRALVEEALSSWRMLPTSANGQLAVGTYERDSSGVYAPHGVTVLTLRANKIDQIVAYHGPWMLERFGLPQRA